MVTTIQVSEKIKRELSSLKKDESYEDVIKRLLRENKKRLIAEQMKEYGQKYDARAEVNEWIHTETKW